MTERTTVRLPEELLERARRKAASENRTLTSLIEDGLRVVVDQNRRTEKKRRITPRISKAGGGLMPGVDLTNPSALQEVDDLDAIGRMRRFE
jgi:hypothetical protein